MSRLVGTNDSIVNSTFAGANQTNGSISIWIKPSGWSSGDGTVHVFWFFTASSDRPSFQHYNDNTLVIGWDSGSGRIIISDSGLFSDGVWAHWLFTWDSSGGQVLYRNGVSVGSNANTSFTNAASQFTVGNYPTAVGSNFGSNAYLADFAYWS